jgi:hypothetical protein
MIDMTVEEYRKHPALNFSLAKHLLDSPAHFKAAQDEESEPSEAMILGTLTHAFVLENKDMRDEYALKPDGMSFATKEGKAWRDAQTKPILADEKAQRIPLCADSLAKSRAVRKLLKLCPNRETPIICQYRGIEIKALLDMHDVGLIADFKTAMDCAKRPFAWKIRDYHYDMQAAWYQVAHAAKYEISEPAPFYWLAVELKQPFARSIFKASDSLIESGLAKMDKAIELYKECLASGKWDLPECEPEEIDYN